MARYAIITHLYTVFLATDNIGYALDAYVSLGGSSSFRGIYDYEDFRYLDLEIILGEEKEARQ